MKTAPAMFSCGAVQLYELSNYYQVERATPKEMLDKNPTSKELADFALKACYYRQPFIVFSDNIDKSKAGIKLAEYIEKNNLGTITESPIGFNPGHMSQIKIWIWTIDRRLK